VRARRRRPANTIEASSRAHSLPLPAPFAPTFTLQAQPPSSAGPGCSSGSAIGVPPCPSPPAPPEPSLAAWPQLPSVHSCPSGQIAPWHGGSPHSPVSGSHHAPSAQVTPAHLLGTQVGPPSAVESHAWPSGHSGSQVGAQLPSTHFSPCGQLT